MGRELKSGDCKGECAWSSVEDTGTGDNTIDGVQVFACNACGSEWTHDQTWTPRNGDGELDPGVAAERAAHPVSSSPW